MQNKAVFEGHLVLGEKNKALNNIVHAKIIRSHYVLKYHEQQLLKKFQWAESPTLLIGACVFLHVPHNKVVRRISKTLKH